MVYNSNTISIVPLATTDSLQLNKFFVSNSEWFFEYLPKTLADNSTLDGTRAYIKKKMTAAENNKEFVFTIKDRYSIYTIGLVIIKNINWDKKQGELAYCIDRQNSGKGLMSEAIKAISNHTAENLGLRTLHILAHKSNRASVKVALNAGFEWKATLPKAFAPPNKPALDMELYVWYCGV